MENLPPISKSPFTLDEMYGVIQESKDYSVIRKYESRKPGSPGRQNPTKKGSYLDDEIKQKVSPGPACTSCITQTNPTSSPTGPKSQCVSPLTQTGRLISTRSRDR